MEPCNYYEEDPYICDDVGEPKGQCLYCGWGEKDHKEFKMPAILSCGVGIRTAYEDSIKR